MQRLCKLIVTTLLALFVAVPALGSDQNQDSLNVDVNVLKASKVEINGGDDIEIPVTDPIGERGGKVGFAFTTWANYEHYVTVNIVKTMGPGHKLANTTLYLTDGIDTAPTGPAIGGVLELWDTSPGGFQVLYGPGMTTHTEVEVGVRDTPPNPPQIEWWDVPAGFYDNVGYVMVTINPDPYPSP